MAKRRRRREQRTPLPAAEPVPVQVGEGIPVSARFVALKRRAVRWGKRNWILIALLAVAALLRFGWLGHQDLWVDELNTYYDALNLETRNPFTHFHWLSFQLYRAALFVKDSAYFLRVPSALSGVLVLIPFYLLVRERLKKPEALLLTALLAFMPYSIQYSMEARYYAFVFFFSTLALWFLARFCLHASLLSLIFFFLAEGAAVLCHPAAGPVAAGAGLAIALWISLRPKWLWKRAKARFKVYTRRYGKVFPLIVVSLESIVLLAVITAAVIAAYRLGIRQTIARWNQPLPSGIEFSVRFFENHLTRFGMGRWFVPLIPAGQVCALIGLFGLFVAWWRYRFFALLVTSVYGCGLGLLFVYRADIPYTIKYSSGLAPAFLLLLGIGIVELGRLASRILRQGTPVKWAAGFTASMILLWTPSLYVQYTGQFAPVQDGFRYVKQHSSGSIRPCIAAQGIADSNMAYYRDSAYPSLFSINTYTKTWPWESLSNFMESLGHSRVPLWAAVFERDYARGGDPAKFGEWEPPVKIQSLAQDQYSLLLFRKAITSSGKPVTVSLPDGGFRRECEWFDNINPRWAGVMGDGDARALIGVSTFAADYEVPGVEFSPVRIALYGRNKSEHPRAVELRVGQTPLGVVVFPANQDKPSTSTIVCNFPTTGTATLSLTVLDSTLPANYEATYSKDSIELFHFTVRPIPLEEFTKPIATESILVGYRFGEIAKSLRDGRFTRPGAPNQLLPDLRVFPETSTWSLENEEGPGETICLVVKRANDTGGIAFPLTVIDPGLMLYISFQLKTEHLNTHAANARIEFYDEKGVRCGVAYASNQALRGDEPWRRMVYVTVAPDNAKAYRVIVDYWKATEPVRSTDGIICVRDLRNEWTRVGPVTR